MIKLFISLIFLLGIFLLVSYGVINKALIADNVDVEYKNLGIAYNLSKDVSVSYGYANAERTGKTAEEKIHNVAVGYSLGPVNTSLQYNKISDAGATTTGPTAGTDYKYVILKAGTAF